MKLHAAMSTCNREMWYRQGCFLKAVITAQN